MTDGSMKQISVYVRMYLNQGLVAYPTVKYPTEGSQVRFVSRLTQDFVYSCSFEVKISSLKRNPFRIFGI